MDIWGNPLAANESSYLAQQRIPDKPDSPRSSITDSELSHPQLVAWAADAYLSAADSELTMSLSSTDIVSTSVTTDSDTVVFTPEAFEHDSEEPEDFLMSGGLGLEDIHPSENHCCPKVASFNDLTTNCSPDFKTLCRRQPFRLLDRDDIYEFALIHNWLEEPLTIFQRLPLSYMTTALGVRQSLHQAFLRARDSGEVSDEILLGELYYFGGYVAEWKSVVYPEDLVPYFGPDDDWYEAEYWGRLTKQGAIWTEAGLDEDVYDFETEDGNDEDGFWDEVGAEIPDDV